jgi:hypothetical protein
MYEKETHIVTYHTDIIDSNACYYDAPGPAFFYYRPKSKNTFSQLGKWVEVHPKYRKPPKNGFCFGDGYGIMKMPRFAASITCHVSCKNWSAVPKDIIHRIEYNEICEYANNIASTLVKKLNKSGDLLISFGDLHSIIDSVDKTALKIQFNLGMTLQVLPITSLIALYSRKAFVWKSTNNTKEKSYESKHHRST